MPGRLQKQKTAVDLDGVSIAHSNTAGAREPGDCKYNARRLGPFESAGRTDPDSDVSHLLGSADRSHVRNLNACHGNAARSPFLADDSEGPSSL